MASHGSVRPHSGASRLPFVFPAEYLPGLPLSSALRPPQSLLVRWGSWSRSEHAVHVTVGMHTLNEGGLPSQKQSPTRIDDVCPLADCEISEVDHVSIPTCSREENRAS